jgi:hypothetical protein
MDDSRQALRESRVVPIDVTVAELSLTEYKFDGKLVRVRARPEMGWEGDSFLCDPPPGSYEMCPDRPKLWFSVDPAHEKELSRVFWSTKDDPVVGTFLGYFHLVPINREHIGEGIFDPGPFHLRVIGVSDVRPPQDPREKPRTDN